MRDMVQVHVSGFACRYGHAYDAHLLPAQDILSEVSGLLRYNSVRYITLEYYKKADDAARCLRRIRELI
jgi:hypothetical protein